MSWEIWVLLALAFVILEMSLGTELFLFFVGDTIVLPASISEVGGMIEMFKGMLKN